LSFPPKRRFPVLPTVANTFTTAPPPVFRQCSNSKSNRIKSIPDNTLHPLHRHDANGPRYPAINFLLIHATATDGAAPARVAVDILTDPIVQPPITSAGKGP
jgi:hypothetical protein